jgi:hypothetical protein
MLEDDTMRLNPTSIDIEQLNESIECMTTETFVLNRVGTDELEWFTDLLKEPRFHLCAGFKKAPSSKRLKEALFEEVEFVAWTASGHGTGEPVGICAWVGFSGMPYLFFEPINPTEIGAEVLQELMEPVVHVFFEFTPGKELLVYVPRPVEDDLHLMLVESGFDPVEHLPGINNEKEMGYLLARSTYNTYFNEDDEGDLDGP